MADPDLYADGQRARETVQAHQHALAELDEVDGRVGNAAGGVGVVGEEVATRRTVRKPRRGRDDVSRVIAVANQKGGVAKTTTVANLGAALHDAGCRVLLVDMDPQASLTVWSGRNPDDLDKTTYDCLIKDVDSREILLPTPMGPDLLPANIDLSLAEMELIHTVNRERRLAGMLAPLRDDYDFVLMDCQPSLGLLTVNAFAAADEVLVPLVCEFLSTRAVDVLLRVLRKVQVQVNSKLKVAGILPDYVRRASAPCPGRAGAAGGAVRGKGARAQRLRRAAVGALRRGGRARAVHPVVHAHPRGLGGVPAPGSARAGRCRCVVQPRSQGTDEFPSLDQPVADAPRIDVFTRKCTRPEEVVPCVPVQSRFAQKWWSPSRCRAGRSGGDGLRQRGTTCSA